MMFLFSICYGATLRVDSGFDRFNMSLGLKALETETSYSIANQIYDKLLDFDIEGKIIPALAVSWSYIDPLTLELKLREGVEFHNGEPFDAKTVKFSLEYFIGRNMFASQMLGPIYKVEVVDPHTIRLKTRKKDGLLLQRLAFWSFVYPCKYIKDNGPETVESNPIGTGPYILDSGSKDDKVILRKNERYWDKKVVLFDKVIISRKSINGKGYTGNTSDDVAHIIINPEAREAIQIARGGMYKVKKIPSLYEVYGVFNLRNPSSPIHNVKIRKAINLALNREALQRLILKGNGRILSSLSMPGEIGHDASLKPYDFNLLKARSLLAESGYSGTVRIKAGLQPDVSPDSNYIKYLIANLRQANIVLEIDENFSLDDIIATNIDSGTSFWNGDMVIGGDPSPYMHSDFVIYQFFVKGALFNMFRSEEFDDLYENASSTLDINEQDSKYKVLDKYIYDNALALFSHQQIRVYAVHKSIDYEPRRNGMLNLRYVTIKSN